ncbi:MAG TPA: hypothetical protein VNU46_09330 [Gemmatimonadaceae bacterium]|jgi:cell division protein FtsL|nr:hypothetical protein [Gemmatimonadaceae bacterium]
MAKSGLDPESPKARSRRRARGRSIVTALLIGFVLVASLVIWRRSYGFTVSRELVALDQHRKELEAEEAHLHSEIRDGSSRAQLGSVAERLGMHIPNDEQVRMLPR